MFKKKLMSVLLYGAIMAAGLAVGLGAAKLPKLLERPYQQGDYSSHFAGVPTKVVVYGTSTCPFCAKARDYLKERKVAFADIQLETDPGARDKYAALHVKAVPAILIGDRLITGFRPDVIDDALKVIAH